MQATQSLQKLQCYCFDRWHGNASELVPFQEFEEVHAQELKRDAQVISEDEAVEHANDVLRVSRIAPCVELLEYFRLDAALFEVGRTVLADLECDDARRSEDLALHNLTEVALT